MTLEFNPDTQDILFKDRVVGRYIYENGRGHLRIDITYECEAESGIVPLCWLASALDMIGAGASLQPADFTFETTEDGLTESSGSLRYLIEKEIKAGGYVWSFYKTDVDVWPSPLHGHEYEHRLKLDAITGRVYDAVTRKYHCSLKSKELEALQRSLRQSKDFADKAALHLV